MGQTREIKGRMKAVANIQRITRTMQMIATSKFARAQQQALAAKPFTEGVFELVRELAATSKDISHPLINGPTGGPKADAPTVWLIITSDRGLCGSYNTSVLRMAFHELERSDIRIETELVGKKGVSFLRFQGVAVTRHHTHFGDTPRREDINALADQYMSRFTAGEIAGVRIASMRFISAGRQKPEILQLLPLKPPVVEASSDTDEKRTTGAVYEFSPPAATLLDDLLPVTVRATLHQSFSDAIVSEHVARMIAMKSATDNASKMSKALTQKFNRARQTQITTELTEIISGAAALA